MNSPIQSEPRFFNSSEILKKYGISGTISDYLDEIIEYNRKVNLVSRETTRDQLLRIAADCLVPFEFIPPPPERIFDIGPGAGFPSVVLMLVWPKLEAVLIERTGKKAAFLQHIGASFNLRLNVISADLQDAIRLLPEVRFNFGAMKLVRIDKTILSAVCRLLSQNGRFLYYAAVDADSAFIPPIFAVRRIDYYLDDSGALRSITQFVKKS